MLYWPEKLNTPLSLIVIFLNLPGPDIIDAKGNLVLAPENIHVVGILEAGDREPSQRAGAATYGEPAVADCHLQKIRGALIRFVTPSLVMLIPSGLVPRSSLLRPSVKWKEFTVVGLRVYVSPNTTVWARSTFPEPWSP